MSYLRNILFILCCWSVGNTLLATTACLFDKADASYVYVDPRMPKIQAAFNQEANDELDVQSSSSFSPAILEQTALVLTNEYTSIKDTDSCHFIKKQYLFTYSGTSPPFIS